MGFIVTLIMLAGLQQCILVQLPCPNNCLRTSNITCEVLPCVNGCNPGWYGTNCNKACNQSCLYLNCNQDDGTCTKENLLEPMNMRSGDRCLDKDRTTNKCTCCESKYRGDNCEIVCDRCKTIRNQECDYFCESGYYGAICNNSCPQSCEPGNDGNPVCREQDGAVKCLNGCPKGSYGNLCESSCNKECNNSICMQKNGHCVDCIVGYSGDFCDQLCDPDCVDKECFKTNGTCMKGCVDDKICTGPCPKNCMELDGSVCDNSNSIPCINGCVDGFYGPTCEDACEDSCKKCNQTSGECVISHDTTLTESGQTGGSSAMIAGICVAAFIILLAVLVFVYIKRTDRNISGCCVCTRGRRSLETGPSPEETIYLRSPEEPSTSTVGEETSHLSSLEEPSTSTAGGRSIKRHDNLPAKGSVRRISQHFEKLNTLPGTASSCESE